MRASIAFTGSARSYDFRGSFTPGGGSSNMPAGITVTTTGTIDVDPFAMVSHASLGGSMPITTYQDGQGTFTHSSACASGGTPFGL